MWKLIKDVNLKDSNIPNYVATDGLSTVLVEIASGNLIDKHGDYIEWATHIMKLPKLPR